MLTVFVEDLIGAIHPVVVKPTDTLATIKARLPKECCAYDTRVANVVPGYSLSDGTPFSDYPLSDSSTIQLQLVLQQEGGGKGAKERREAKRAAQRKGPYAAIPPPATVPPATTTPPPAAATAATTPSTVIPPPPEATLGPSDVPGDAAGAATWISFVEAQLLVASLVGLSGADATCIATEIVANSSSRQQLRRVAS